ncbi:iron-containing alcohol dehydrogenase [Aestuariispira insulae]|uniref:Alcohol dehydrogenase 2 n=1 Tax=Aestuariispira insulae TaxID=1461337 RepID=A0A3D9HMP2_9PROT|nr:iron-containing alcohol dehydrogenase [Aestuariispira insulae]RED50770.1 alcohol dehydrogenase [Aestuariispira insulae]
MGGFSFHTTKSFLCEPGAANGLASHAEETGMSRILLVTDAAILKLGLLEDAIQSLVAAGLSYQVFQDVTPDPEEAIVLAAVDLARDMRADGVVAIGGGSSMDVAKLVAVLATSEQELSDIYGVGQVRGRRLPLILAPTTAGTGSEVTPISIITTGRNEKMGVVSPQLLPDMALLDADLTLGLPASVTAATGIDAMVHSIEAYTSKIRKNPISDMLAVKALGLLSGNIREAVFNGGNREARSNMLLGAMLAGQAFANAPVGGVHALAYPLGGHFHVPHGLSNALVLTAVMRFNHETCADQYRQLAPIVFPDGLDEAGDPALDLIGGLARLTAELGLETRLGQVGVREGDLDLLAADAMKQQRLLVNNPRKMTFSAAREIYETVL